MPLLEVRNSLCYYCYQLFYFLLIAGAPDKVKANITVNLRQGTVFLTLSVVDNSDAPAQHFFLNIPGIYNKTLSPKNYSNNYNYKNLLNKSAELFGNEDTHYLSVTAINDLGTAVVFNETVNVPVEREFSIEICPNLSCLSYLSLLFAK